MMAPGSSAAKPVILLIEHDQLTLRVLRGILRSRGFEVIATSEPTGFERIMGAVDVVICANDMPFVTMKDLLQAIKERWPRKRVFLTSVTSFDELAKETHDHIDGFVSKPFEMDRLNDMIGQIAA
jgi:DNA-binding NtrC family response regulator